MSDEMYHQVRWVLGSLGLVVCFAANPLQAGFMTFNVNLSGVAGSGHMLKVFGTITVDPAQPISSATTTSTLFFQHQSDVFSLPSTFNNGPSLPDQMEWSLVGQDLYISRRSSTDQTFGWGRLIGQVDIDFVFGSGLEDHFLRYVIRNPSDPDSDKFLLKPSGPADGPNGFLVGTAIPEPSSALLVAGIGAVFSLARRHRR
jgi:hypothetical protein